MIDIFIPLIVVILIVSGYILGCINMYVCMKENKKNSRVTKEQAIIEREEERVNRILLCTECVILGYWIDKKRPLIKKDITVRCKACGKMATHEIILGN